MYLSDFRAHLRADPRGLIPASLYLANHNLANHKKNAFMSRGFLLAFVLLLSGCLPKEPLVQIPSAENIRQLSDGRIFITGKDALYQLQQDEQGFRTVPVARDTRCSYFAGLAELNQWLFFVCAQSSGLRLGDLKFDQAGVLKAYSLEDGRLIDVMALSGFQFPNGLDALPEQNAILIADEDFFVAQGGVSKAVFDFSAGEPVLSDYVQHWIGPQQQVYAANGVRVWEGDIYLTDIGFFKRVPLQVDGTPGAAQILYRNLTVLDDFDRYCDGFLITDFVKGRLVYVPVDGSAVRVSPPGLSSPSAILAQPGSGFQAGSVLVTESRGVQAGQGNQLVMVDLAALGVETCSEAP
ncbi:MAG: hypothetical protein D9N14_17090 [Ketobacter sp.]|nr:MAG: hypothetical protein D9N14_17090 [Ketobacter sp.]